MKKLLLLAYLLLCNLVVWGIQRSPEEALSIAHSFFKQSSQADTRNTADIRLVAVSNDLLSVPTRAAEEVAFYIYNSAQSAYVIVSGDDRMKPVLAYSYEGVFNTEDLPENILGWLTLYQEAYTELDKSATQAAKPMLLTSTTFPGSIEPLLGDIKWNQSTPYNNDCPVVSGERCVAGCVATAMGMMMKYHEYPVKGKGSHTYTENDITSSFDFGNTTFDWDNMLPEYISGRYTSAQAAAVAKLTFACGVAVEMMYSPSGSGAYSHKVAQALIDYFGYDENLKYIRRQYFTATEWMNMIKSDISRGLPVLYNGASKEVGHEFIFDGYDANDMVHVNWGWGGANNGYFEVSSLDPASPGIGGGTGTGGGFVYQQGMIIGFQPPVATSSYTSHFSLSTLTASKDKVVKGEAFDIVVTNIFNMSTLFNKGKLGVVAEKSGQQFVISEKTLADVKSGYGAYELTFENVTFPNTLSDGIYALYLATKEERESTWSRVRGQMGYETQFTLVVTSNNCALTPFTGTLSLENDIDGMVEPLHSLYSGKTGSFAMTFTNENATEDYYGVAGVMFLDENMDIVALIGDAQLELKPGATKTISVSGSLIANQNDVSVNIPAGDYYICPAMQWGEYIYSIGQTLKEVTVSVAFGKPSLVVANPRLEKDELEPGETIKLQADLSLSGVGSVYEAKLMAAIFASGQGSTSNLFYSEVFVERSVPYSFEMEIETILTEGSYRINLYKPEADGKYNGENPICTLPFTIGTSTGIEPGKINSEGIFVYQQPVENILHIRTVTEAKTIAIHNLSGQALIQIQLSESSNGEYFIPVEKLATGYYIVTIQLASGKTYRSKFIKK